MPAGQPVTVSGYTIPGGLLFVGRNLSAVSGDHAEPALIDPRLPVDRENPNRAGTDVPYWPSYSSITPSDRAAYLEWLAEGRSRPDAYIGYIFLFFYGLERRALAGPERLKTATAELRAFAVEVERRAGGRESPDPDDPGRGHGHVLAARVGGAHQGRLDDRGRGQRAAGRCGRPWRARTGNLAVSRSHGPAGRGDRLVVVTGWRVGRR
ncbi:MAG: TerB N-terminal domain-containing protein [Candidatus Rokubacteria bacterium]|nr:TerB N-terminal domain-containing protein [Candidatus Rokubacteria bacterium]